MTTRRAPELYSFGKYYAAASARVLCSTHTQQGPRIRSRETAAPWVIKSLAPNIFFRVCVCVCALPQAPNATTGRRNNNSRNRVSTKSLSASHPCAGPSLREASPRPQAAGPQV